MDPAVEDGQPRLVVLRGGKSGRRSSTPQPAPRLPIPWPGLPSEKQPPPEKDFEDDVIPLLKGWVKVLERQANKM